MNTKVLSTQHACSFCATEHAATALAALPDKSGLNSHTRSPPSPAHSTASRRATCKLGVDNSSRRLSTLVKASDRDSDLVDTLKDDLARFQKKQAAGSAPSNGTKSSQAEGASSVTGSLKQTLDKVLIADFFFILVALAWLAAGVGEKSTLNSSRLLDAWYPLWTLLFQPALGVLMLGALVSGAAGWLKNRSSA